MGIAYSSDETGEDEIYVRPFPDASGPRTRISLDGSIQPEWDPSGDELYYVDRRRNLTSVRFTASGALTTMGRQVLYRVPDEIEISPIQDFYDVSPIDGRFLMSRAVRLRPDGVPATRIILAQNFHDERGP